MLVTALMRKDVGKEDVPTTKQTSGYQLRHQGGDASINTVVVAGMGRKLWVVTVVGQAFAARSPGCSVLY